MTRASVRAERGLVGKILVLWLVGLALVVVAALDAGSILLARFHTAGIARAASAAAAEAFDRTDEREAALRAALATIEAGDDDAHLKEFRVTGRGKVVIVVVDRASTLLAGRIGFFDHLTRITATDESAPRTG